MSFIRPSLLSCDELGLDRELVGREPQCLFREGAAHAADLQDDPPGSHHGHPVVGRTLARSHPHFSGLLGHGLVGKHVDPDGATTLEVVRDRAPRGFDLACRHPARLHGLERVVALRDPVATLCRALHPAALELAVLEALRLQHLADPCRLRCRRGWRWRRRWTLRRGGGRARLRDLPRGGLDLALVDPRLHADRAVRRLRGGTSELDIAAERVQRDAPLALPLASAHLGASEATGDRDANALRARLHRALHGLLQDLAEGHAPLELLRDVLGDEVGVELRVADLEDVHLDHLAGHLSEDLPELLDLRATLTDHDARFGRLDRHGDLVRRALDVDARDRRVAEPSADGVADPDVLFEEHRVVLLVREPLRVPRLRETEAEPDRMRFLTHYLASSLVETDFKMRHAVHLEIATTAAAVPHALHARALVRDGALHVQVLERQVEVVLCVGDGRPDDAAERQRGRFRKVLEDGDRFLRALPLDEVGHEARLPRGEPQKASRRLHFHLGTRPDVRRALGRAGAGGRSRPWRGRGARRLGGRDRAPVSAEAPRRGEFAEPVPDHVLGDEDGHVTPAVVYGDRVPDHDRQDHRGARPGLHDLLLVPRVQHVDLLFEGLLDERSLLYGSTHYLDFLLGGRSVTNRSVRGLLRVLRPMAGLPHGVCA